MGDEGSGQRRRQRLVRLDKLQVEGVSPTRTLWVPCGVEALHLSSVTLMGGLFAPTVSVRADRSSVRGGVTARTLLAR